MIVRVSDIPEEGLRFEGTGAFPEPFQDRTWRLEDARLAVEKDGDVVFVTGHLRSRVPQVCSRCLESYEATVDAAVDTRLVPAPVARGEERELGTDDLETDVYDHDQIDLNALLETETTLGLPMKPLCGEGCRGLCPSCGASRNAAPCGCAPAVDPRWSPLKGLADRLSK
ncbi:MAG TPA: DUF177 domain-containing protein [Candidatus Bathyarchaeia archaeon]|nr:DUF177 domain-containing protein [Candidatus Bathyarchaeia archaeon]